MSLRALSSDGQSTSLTRKGSAVQVRQRPRSALTSVHVFGQRPLFARDAAETQPNAAAKQRPKSATRRTGRESKTESKLIGDRIQENVQENRELREQGFSEPGLLEQPGSARLSPGPLYPAVCRCNYYIRIMPILLLVIPERGRAPR